MKGAGVGVGVGGRGVGVGDGATSWATDCMPRRAEETKNSQGSDDIHHH